MTKLAQLIKKGPLKYRHYYMAGSEVVYHTQDVPKILKTLAQTCPDAEVIKIGNYSHQDTIGIEVDSKLWAAEKWGIEQWTLKRDEFKKIKLLSEDVWNYLSLALGIHKYPGWDGYQGGRSRSNNHDSRN